MSYFFKIIILSEINIKLRFFNEKLQKSPSVGGSDPRSPCFRRLRPQAPAKLPHWEFLATPLLARTDIMVKKVFKVYPLTLNLNLILTLTLKHKNLFGKTKWRHFSGKCPNRVPCNDSWSQRLSCSRFFYNRIDWNNSDKLDKKLTNS